MPGLERKHVEVSLEDNVLTIRGEKKLEEENKDENRKNHHLTESSYGAFYRILELPPGVDPSTAQATMSKGVLKITIPKPAHVESKRIEVKDAARTRGLWRTRQGCLARSLRPRMIRVRRIPPDKGESQDGKSDRHRSGNDQFLRRGDGGQQGQGDRKR
jgi:hypothetical protein